MARLFGKKEKRPGPRDVATRAVVLKFVSLYVRDAVPPDDWARAMAYLPAGKRKAATQEYIDYRDEFWGHLESLGRHLTPWEREFSGHTCTEIDPESLTIASWRAESLHVLLWALGRMPSLSRWDTVAKSSKMDAVVLIPFKEFIASADLIDPEVIDKARGTAELWHWRSRSRQCQEEGVPFPSDAALRKAGLDTYEGMIRFAAENAAEEGTIPKPIDGDFPALGKAYRDLTSDEWSLVASIAQERHFALNWLCGMAPGNRWDETPTPT